MATKPKQAQAPTAPAIADPLADLLVSPEAAMDDPSMAADGPEREYRALYAEQDAEQDAGRDDDGDDLDEDDDDDPEDAATPAPDPQPAQAGPARTSRRGFLGAVAGLAGAAAVSAAIPPEVAGAAPAPPLLPQAAEGGMTPDMAMMSRMFGQLMDQRDASLLAELDRRLSAIRAELPVPNGVAHMNAPAELAHRPGEYPPSMMFSQPTVAPAGGPREPIRDTDYRPMDYPPPGYPQAGYQGPWPQTRAPAQAQPPAPRMVAFIPKEDAYNPRQTMFKGWVNGRELRARRGQIMIVSLGTGVDWAKNGHGNCVDIAAMQGVGTVEPMRVPQAPDFSRPANWDGAPLDNRSSIPMHAAN